MTTNVSNVPDHMSHINARNHNEGIMPKGPYLPCVSMADRALLEDTIELRGIGLCVLSVPISLVDDCENMCTLSHYRHQTESMNHLPLFGVRFWNSGMRRMSFYVVMAIHNAVWRQGFEFRMIILHLRRFMRNYLMYIKIVIIMHLKLICHIYYGCDIIPTVLFTVNVNLFNHTPRNTRN